MNGFAQACTRLNLSMDNTSRMEAAMLIARLKYPEPKHCGILRENQISRRAKHILWRNEELSVDVTKKSYQGV
jgi:hypothetical protein